MPGTEAEQARWPGPTLVPGPNEEVQIMERQNAQIGWTDAQWSQVYQAVSEAANRASVAGAFLPCYGPLARSAEVVRREKVHDDDESYIWVDDVETIKLWTLAVHVQLKNQQLAEENLTGALLAFRRAANLLATQEDFLVFNGLPRRNRTHERFWQGLPPQVRVGGRDAQRDGSTGLVEEGGLEPVWEDQRAELASSTEGGRFGGALVSRIAESIARLETRGHLRPFACVMGNGAFQVAYTPEPGSLVLPSDRIKPLLEGPLLRSGTMQPYDVIVVSLAGDPIDLVVATEPTVQFLNVTDDARYLFRVYERFALRIKEDGAVNSFWLGQLEPSSG